MKVIAKQISVMATFDTKGSITPLKFKMQQDDDSFIMINVNRVIHKDFEKLAGNPMYIFRCQSVIDDHEKVYELKYEINTCRWMIFKM